MTNDRPTSASVRVRSIALIALIWSVLQIGGLFSPGLLEDVDSIYIEIAREMLHRHDFITPYIDGIRFFDKPPLMYWMAAASMHLFGEHDWAARLPLALALLALLLSVYALGLRLFRRTSPVSSPDRGALYSALALATAVGPYLYTRFFIPDILIALWMTLSVHFFLIALDRAAKFKRVVVLSEARSAESKDPDTRSPAATVETTQARLHRSSLLPCLAFSATLALNLLTKGLIGLVFPLVFAFLYLLLTRQLRLLPRLHPFPSTAVFAVIALPWHILAALRNPAIAMPAGLGLPTHAGWAWFYLYNEHFARFLGKRVPHDYGQTPIWLFWLYAAIWIMPWTTFLPAAFVTLRRQLGHHLPVAIHERESALTLTLWTLIVLVFFTFSSRQEYYSLPALPALALITGGLLASAESSPSSLTCSASTRLALLWHRWFLLPLASLAAVVCAWYAFTAPHPAPGTDVFSLLTTVGDPSAYNLSLSHLSDLTSDAMGLFRLPLALTAIGFAAIGLLSYILRHRGHSFAANLTLAAGMVVVLLAAHEGLTRFYPIVGSKGLALAILRTQRLQPEPDLILIDGELTTASSLLFYTRQPVHLVNGRINGPWFGSFWPDAPAIFESTHSLQALWHGPRRLFLLTYNPAARTADLAPFGPVHTLAAEGGKTILTNR